MKDIKILFAVALAAMSFSVTACSDDDGGDKGNPATQKECTADKDCKDASKPVCSKEGKCVAKSNSDTNTGTGTGTGSGDGSGTGTGTGTGSGDGSGTGTGSGDGSGTGTGSGDGSGTGSGTGTGTGSEVGSECTVGTFTETCDGNTAVFCDEGAVAKIDCAAGGNVCDKIKGENFVDCFENDDVCSKVGDKSTICYDDDFGVYTGETECTEMESGKNRFIDITENDEDYNDCDASTQVCDSRGEKCITVAEITNTACTEETENECKAGKLVTCEDVSENENEESYKLVNIDCTKMDAACATATGVDASCIPNKSTCKDGESKAVCESQLMGLVSFQYTATCTKFSNDTWHFTGSNAKQCKNACNEAGTACDAQGVMEKGSQE